MLLEIIIIILSTVLLVYVAGRLREPANLPSGPRPLPLIGNLLDIDMKCVHQSFMKLADKYGSVFTVYLGGERVVVVNTLSAMREALITRKDDFAGRPITFVQSFLTWGSNITFQDFGPRFLLHRGLLDKAIKKYTKTQLEGNVTFNVCQLIKRFKMHGSSGAVSFDPRRDIQIEVFNVVLALLFGERSEENEKFLQYNDKVFELLGTVNLLNMFPWLIHFPTKASRELKYWVEIRDEIFITKYNEHVESFVDGRQRDFTDALIQAQKDEERQGQGGKDLITRLNVIAMMQDVLLGGTDTTSAGLLWTLVFLIRHPEVQAKIHKELDDVIGRERVPLLEDKDKLPYLQATILESNRLSPLATIAVPHKATKDSTIKEYHIPKGTTVMLNFFAINHDAIYWEDPHSFNPMRFIDEDGQCNVKSQTTMTFGVGRRSCPGKSVAQVELFMFMSRLLHQFEFSVPPGCPPPGIDSTFGLVSKPVPFKICCKDRLNISS